MIGISLPMEMDFEVWIPIYAVGLDATTVTSSIARGAWVGQPSVTKLILLFSL